MTCAVLVLSQCLLQCYLFFSLNTSLSLFLYVDDHELSVVIARQDDGTLQHEPADSVSKVAADAVAEPAASRYTVENRGKMKKGSPDATTSPLSEAFPQHLARENRACNITCAMFALSIDHCLPTQNLQ